MTFMESETVELKSELVSDVGNGIRKKRSKTYAGNYKRETF